MTEFAHDALHSVLHFDGKIWRTLPLLAWKPGDLTRRYVHGERAKFVSPLALFLFCVVVAYATVAWTEPLTFELHNDKSLPEVEQEIEEARAGVVAGIEKLDRQLVAAQAAGQVDANVTRRISSERASLVNRQTAMANRLLGFKAVARTLATNKANNEAAISALQSQLSDARQKGSVTQQIDGELAAEQLNKKSIDKSIETLKTDTLSAVEIEQALGSDDRLFTALAQAAKSPQFLLYKLQANGYKFAWALIPLSVPLVWLLFFWKREFKLFDHAVFVTYSLCFMLMLCALLVLLLLVPGAYAAAAVAMALLPPIHMFRQVRHAYGLSRWGALWRTLLLLSFASTVLGLFAALILALGMTA